AEIEWRGTRVVDVLNLIFGFWRRLRLLGVRRERIFGEEKKREQRRSAPSESHGSGTVKIPSRWKCPIGSSKRYGQSNDPSTVCFPIDMPSAVTFTVHG